MVQLQLGWTPLMIAVSTGHLEIVGMLLQTKKVDVEQSNTSGARPLHYACSKNHYEVSADRFCIQDRCTKSHFIIRSLNCYWNTMLTSMLLINTSKHHWIVLARKEIFWSSSSCWRTPRSIWACIKNVTVIIHRPSSNDNLFDPFCFYVAFSDWKTK